MENHSQLDNPAQNLCAADTYRYQLWDYLLRRRHRSSPAHCIYIINYSNIEAIEFPYSSGALVGGGRRVKSFEGEG